MTDGNDLIQGTKTIQEEGLNDFGGHAFFDKQVPSGLTKRELFAAMAMQGMCANAQYSPTPDTASNFAADGVTYADALIDALNK